MKYKKLKIIAGIILFVIIYGCIGSTLVSLPPFKVTDPKMPGFDVTKFDFNDYPNYEKLSDVFQEIFRPEITTLEEVDIVFCKKTPCGKAGKEYRSGNQFEDCMEQNSANWLESYWYGKKARNPILGGWSVHVLVGQDNKMVNICSNDLLVFNMKENRND